MGSIRRESVAWIMAGWLRCNELKGCVLAGLEEAGSLQIFHSDFQKEAARQAEKWASRSTAVDPDRQANAEPASQEVLSPSSSSESDAAQGSDLAMETSGSDWDSDMLDKPLDKKQIARMDNVWRREDRLRSATQAKAASTSKKIQNKDAGTRLDDSEESSSSATDSCSS